MSGENQVPEERCRRVGVSGSLRGRRSRVDDPVEYFLPAGDREYFLRPRGGDGN